MHRAPAVSSSLIFVQIHYETTETARNQAFPLGAEDDGGWAAFSKAVRLRIQLAIRYQQGPRRRDDGRAGDFSTLLATALVD